MKRNIVLSILITLGIIVGAILFGTLIVHFFSIDDFIDADSARYFFSAMAQSLAALFALTFVVVNVISAYALKNLAKYVLQYITSRKLFIITIMMFVLSLACNFIYLVMIGDHGLIIPIVLHYSVGIVMCLITFFISVFCLVIYAYITLSVSLNPFDHFHKEITNCFKSNLIALKIYLNNRVEIDELFSEDQFSYNMPIFIDPRRTDEYRVSYKKKKKGYLLNFDIHSLNQAIKLLDNKLPLQRYIGIGDKIQKGQGIYTFDKFDAQKDKMVLNILSNSVEVSDKKPGWEKEFDYLDSMFNKVKTQLYSPSAIGNYITKLLSIADNYLQVRIKIFTDSDYDSRGVYYKEFFDYWLEGYYDLLKSSCVVKSDLIREGKIHHISDEPDFHIISGLRQLCAYLYRIDNVRFFIKVIEYIYKYSDYVTKLSYKGDNLECEISIKHLDQLKIIVQHISSYSSPRNDRDASFSRLYKYHKILIEEYLRNLKPLSTISKHYRRIESEYEHLRKYLIKDIVQEFQYNIPKSDHLAHDNMQTELLATLFSISAYMLADTYNSSTSIERFNTTHRYFYAQYKQDKIWGTDRVFPDVNVDLDKIFDISLLHTSKLWQSIDAEDLAFNYCCRIYLLTLVLSKFSITHNKEFWLKDNKISDLRECFNDLKERSTNHSEPTYNMIYRYVGYNHDKAREAYDKLEALLNEIKP